MSITSMLPIVFVMIAISSVVLVIYSIIRQKRKLNEKFVGLGAELGCSVTPSMGFIGYPSLAGPYRGRPLNVNMFSRSSGRSSTTYTSFNLLVDSGDFSFSIFEQGFFTTLATKLGMQDIQIGDDEFDKEFIIKSNNEDMVKQMLSSEIKMKFMEHARKYVGFGIRLEGSRFYHEFAGTITRAYYKELLVSMINLASDVADNLDKINGRHRR